MVKTENPQSRPQPYPWCIPMTLEEMEDTLLDRTALICFLFFSNNLSMKTIARLFEMRESQVELALKCAFERLQANIPAVSLGLYEFSRE